MLRPPRLRLFFLLPLLLPFCLAPDGVCTRCFSHQVYCMFTYGSRAKAGSSNEAREYCRLAEEGGWLAELLDDADARNLREFRAGCRIQEGTRVILNGRRAEQYEGWTWDHSHSDVTWKYVQTDKEETMLFDRGLLDPSHKRFPFVCQTSCYSDFEIVKGTFLGEYTSRVGHVSLEECFFLCETTDCRSFQGIHPSEVGECLFSANASGGYNASGDESIVYVIDRAAKNPTNCIRWREIKNKLRKQISWSALGEEEVLVEVGTAVVLSLAPYFSILLLIALKNRIYDNAERQSELSGAVSQSSGLQKEAEERTERRKQKPKLLRKFKKSEKGLVLSQDSKSVSESSEKSQFVLPKASRKSVEPPDRSQKAPGKPSKGPGVYPKTPSKSPKTPAKSGTLARKVRKAQDEAPERTKEEKPSRRATAIPRR